MVGAGVGVGHKHPSLFQFTLGTLTLPDGRQKVTLLNKSTELTLLHSTCTNTARTETSRGSPLSYDRLYLTLACTSLSSIPYSRLYFTLVCTSVSSVPQSRLYLTLVCTSVSSIPHSRLYFTLVCTSFSSVPHSRVYLTLACTSL